MIVKIFADCRYRESRIVHDDFFLNESSLFYFSKGGRIYVRGYFPRNPWACRLMVAICQKRLML